MPQAAGGKVTSLLIALGVISFASIYIWCTFSGYYFYDDYTYARYAYQLLHGDFTIERDTFSHRIGFIGLLASAYAVGGVTDFTSVFWPVTFTLGTIAVLYYALRDKPEICFYAVAATGLNSYFLFFIDKVSPDTALAFFTLLTAVVVERYRHRYPVQTGMGAALLFMVAFLVKEPALLSFFPFVVLGTVEYLRERRAIRAFAWAGLVSGILLLIGYFGIYYATTGNALYRFTTIVELHYVHSESYFDKSLPILIGRLTYRPWIMFAESGFLVVLLPGLAVALQQLITRKPDFRDAIYYWSFLGLVMLLTFWFSTTSTRYYNPLPLVPRMYFPIIPPFAILSAYVWSSAERLASSRVLLSGLFGSATVLCVFISSKYLPIYAALAILPWLGGFLSLKRKKLTVSAALINRVSFIVILLGVPVYRMLYPQQWGYAAEKSIFKQYFQHSAGKYLVLTDGRLAKLADWYFAFEPPAHYTFKPIRTATDVVPVSKYDQVYVLHNPHTYREIGESTAGWEAWKTRHASELTEVYKRDGVTLYELNN